LLTQRSPAHLPSGGSHSFLAPIVLIQLVAQVAKAVKSQLAVFQLTTTVLEVNSC